MAPFEPATVDPPLHGDVSFGFQLQIAFARIVAVLVPKRSLDVHGMSIVALDEVRVIAIHRAHEIGKRPENTRGQAGAKRRGLSGQIEGKIGQVLPMSGTEQQWLHRRDNFVPVFGQNVRFHGRMRPPVKRISIITLRLLRGDAEAG